MKKSNLISVTILILVLVIGGLYFYFNKVSIPAGTIQLPIATAGIRYARVIDGVTRENMNTVVDLSKLPPGLSFQLIELPCAPPMPGEKLSADYCSPQPELIGTPTISGNYFFTITTAPKVEYYLRVKSGM